MLFTHCQGHRGVTGEKRPATPRIMKLFSIMRVFPCSARWQEVVVLSRFRSNHNHTRRPENVGRVPLFSVDYPARIYSICPMSRCLSAISDSTMSCYALSAPRVLPQRWVLASGRRHESAKNGSISIFSGRLGVSLEAEMLRILTGNFGRPYSSHSGKWIMRLASESKRIEICDHYDESGINKW